MNYKEKKILIAPSSPKIIRNSNIEINNESVPPPKPKRLNSSANNLNIKFQYPNYITKNFEDMNHSLNVNN
jgi:hypothetical protein